MARLLRLKRQSEDLFNSYCEQGLIGAEQFRNIRNAQGSHKKIRELVLSNVSYYSLLSGLKVFEVFYKIMREVNPGVMIREKRNDAFDPITVSLVQALLENQGVLIHKGVMRYGLPSDYFWDRERNSKPFLFETWTTTDGQVYLQIRIGILAKLMGEVR